MLLPVTNALGNALWLCWVVLCCTLKAHNATQKDARCHNLMYWLAESLYPEALVQFP